MTSSWHPWYFSVSLSNIVTQNCASFVNYKSDQRPIVVLGIWNVIRCYNLVRYIKRLQYSVFSSCDYFEIVKYSVFTSYWDIFLKMYSEDSNTPRPLDQIDGLMQERRNSIANALELRHSCTNTSRWWEDIRPVIQARLHHSRIDVSTK